MVGGGKSFAVLERLSNLIRQRNENEVKIARIIGRPAQIGHVGEYLASAIFNIALEESATTPGYDGRFVEGPLAGKTVNVKTYGKREGILDINSGHLPDFFLVFTGSKSPPENSRGKTRPWIIDEVFLFCASSLVERLRERGVKIGIATSVRQAVWEASRIYPDNPNAPLNVTPEQEKMLDLFSSRSLPCFPAQEDDLPIRN